MLDFLDELEEPWDWDRNPHGAEKWDLVDAREHLFDEQHRASEDGERPEAAQHGDASEAGAHAGAEASVERPEPVDNLE